MPAMKKTGAILFALGGTLLFVPNCLVAQSGINPDADRFHTITYTPQKAVKNHTELNNLNVLYKGAKVEYADGLGRLIESVLVKANPYGKDLVDFIEYDRMGRDSVKWLLKMSDGNGNFVPLSAFQGAYDNPYSKTRYDVLGRPVIQQGPGRDWTGRPVVSGYGANYGSDQVRHYSVDSSGQLTCTGFYNPAALSKVTVTDEDGKPSVKYDDKLGRTVMQSHAPDAYTHYVYNDMGQLAYVLPPAAADNLPVRAAAYPETNEYIQKFAYTYKYDNRGNRIYKKLPGCEPIFMVYDSAERMVLAQDGNQRVRNQWTCIVYDVFGRVVMTGLETISPGYSHQTLITIYASRLVKGEFDRSSTVHHSGYSNNMTTFPDGILSVNYYDDYGFIPLQWNVTYQRLICTALTDYDSAYPANSTPNGKGLLTGTRVYKLGSTNEYTATAYYYNDKGEVVQTQSSDAQMAGGAEFRQLDFNGKPLKSLKEQQIEGGTIVREAYSYTYDHAGRTLKTTYKVDEQPEIELSSNIYDGYGRLSEKGRHNDTERDEYSYNIRNWITEIRSGDFRGNFYYTDNPYSPIRYYNGNIAYYTWTYGSDLPKGYLNTYDEQDRLSSSEYREGHMPAQIANRNKETFRYDKMGNIIQLNRYDNAGVLTDDLAFTYSGNQIQTVADAAGSQSAFNLKEYRDLSSAAVQFAYDANGNPAMDLDRDAVTIRYNRLNLPDTIQFRNGSQIINSYDAAGRKLKTLYRERRSATLNPLSLLPGQVHGYAPGEAKEKTVYYSGNILYHEDREHRDPDYAMINNAEGYTKLVYGTPDVYTPYYYRRDHLGNVREVRDIAARATVQRTQYYASGLPWGESTLRAPGANTMLYNGKEYVEAHGLDEFDYGARGYYATVMRFGTIDPKAEKYYSYSPYAYCLNNPVKNIDPDGMDVWSTTDPGEIRRAMESLLRGGSFRYNDNWTHTPDDEFLNLRGSYSAGLNYNSRTGQLWLLSGGGIGETFVSQLTWVPGKGFIEHPMGMDGFQNKFPDFVGSDTWQDMGNGLNGASLVAGGMAHSAGRALDRTLAYTYSNSATKAVHVMFKLPGGNMYIPTGVVKGASSVLKTGGYALGVTGTLMTLAEIGSGQKDIIGEGAWI